ncbi:unnamed protein product [Peniophora sp. CBMAI 1063]|nr:unnamed protein product [Peniophora sp. CBMAI 1063]
MERSRAAHSVGLAGRYNSAAYEETPSKSPSSISPAHVVVEADPYLVEFEVGDPANPHNWSRVKRWYLTLLGGILVLNATFASSVPSGSVPQIMEEFGFGQEVGALTISMFVAGYVVGPILWGPLSEELGRRPVFIISFTFYTGFSVGCALSRNTASIIIFRLLSGIFAAAPFSNSGALVGDIWDGATRAKGMTIFAIAPFAGPSLGPLVSGWLAYAGVSWRWTFWIAAIFALICLLLSVCTLPETYAPVILKKKAQLKLQETGDVRYCAKLEVQKAPLQQRIGRVLGTPFKILFQEPVLIAITAYMSFIFGNVYLVFSSYPIVFTQGHGLNSGVSGMMYLPIPVGGIIGCVVYLTYYNPRYSRAAQELSPAPVPPEKRLEMSLIAGPIFAAFFFIFGFTSYPSINFWVPLVSGVLIGVGNLLISLSFINYIVDMYKLYAASALAANTVVRSIFAAVFPLFGHQMYSSLNPRWASLLLGCFAMLLVPIPFLLVKYGPALRARSRFAPEASTYVPSVSPEKECV